MALNINDTMNINDTKFLEIAEIICEEGLSGLDKAVQIIIINQSIKRC
jgi:hypothetical protein